MRLCWNRVTSQNPPDTVAPSASATRNPRYSLRVPINTAPTAGPATGAVLMGSASEHLGLRLSLAIGALVSCGFWLLTRLRHKGIAAALEDVPTPAGKPSGAARPVERGA